MTAQNTFHTQVKLLAEMILRNAKAYEWELQGFGMLRVYLPDGSRLQVWNRNYAVPDVTTIHDHPWHFQSLIVAGNLVNERFYSISELTSLCTHKCRRIKPGVGLKIPGTEDHPVRLLGKGSEFYGEGMVYKQEAHEIHESRPADGTVTLIQRQRALLEDVAGSFYLIDKQWVSAEPRIATPTERDVIIDHALDTWFGSINPRAQA